MTFDDDYFSSPGEYVRTLAEQGPIHRFTAPHGVSGWLITGYAMAREVFTEPSIIKTPETMNASNIHDAGPAGMLERIKQGANSYMMTHMLGIEEPDHERLRRVAAEPFTPRAVRERAPRMTTVADDLIDRMDPTRPVDLLTTYAVPMPVRIIAEILGIPSKHADAISRGSTLIGDVLCSSGDELRSGAMTFARLILPQLALRAVVSRDDVLGALAAGYRRGGLSLRETVSTAALVLIAGHETTTSLILSTFLNLLTNPGELDRVRADPAALEAVIEETLRLHPPQLVATLRITTEPITLGGQRIEPGEWILISLLAANHDPAVTECPHIFDSTRSPRRSLPFGHGIHTCLGAQLARTEARIAVARLLARYPDIALAADPGSLTWRRQIFFRRLERLPVTLA